MLGRFYKVFWSGFEDVGDIVLGVHIKYGEPAALYLHHDAVALFKYMIDLMQAYGILLYFAGCYGLRLCEASAKPSPENVFGYHELKLTYAGLLLVYVWVYVYHLYYPVGIRAGDAG